MEYFSTKKFLRIALAVLLAGVAILFTYTNHEYYQQPIGEVTKVQTDDAVEKVTLNGIDDFLVQQELTLQIKNGTYQGEQVVVDNTYSKSGAVDNRYKKGDELFLKIEKKEHNVLSASIEGVKRDKYVVLMILFFFFCLLVVGGKKGFFSILSLGVNLVILLIGVDYYVAHRNASLLLITSIMVVLFTVISLIMVSGNNSKTYAAIIATLLGTFVSFFIAALVMHVTKEKGLRYEEMEFLTRSPRKIYLVSILIGSLGAVMDVAITMSAAVYELYEKNNQITAKELMTSGLAVGRDIMGTMSNILFFAYVSGAIPMLLLYLRNGAEIGYTFNMNLSLELVRALAGSIGIVLTIPIGLYSSILFIERGRTSK